MVNSAYVFNVDGFVADYGTAKIFKVSGAVTESTDPLVITIFDVSGTVQDTSATAKVMRVFGNIVSDPSLLFTKWDPVNNRELTLQLQQKIDSNTKNVQFQIGFVPPPPANAPQALSAAAGNAKATLTWSAPSGSVTGYKIYNNGTTLVASPTASPYTITSLANGTTYNFSVSAISSAGESAKSQFAAVVPSVPTGGGGDVIETIPWSAITGANDQNTGTAGVRKNGSPLVDADFEVVPLSQFKVMQTTAKANGTEITFKRVFGTSSENITDIGGITYRYCQFFGYDTPGDRGPNSGAYDAYNRPTGFKTSHFANGSASLALDARSKLYFCDIGRANNDGALVLPWTAGGTKTLGSIYAYAGRIWMTTTTNTSATVPSTTNSNYVDYGVNPSKSVAFSNYISAKINTGTDSPADTILKAGPYPSHTGSNSWSISGDPLMYTNGVWDAYPGKFQQIGLTEGAIYMERCKIQGGGDVTRVNNRCEYQRCSFLAVQKGWSGGFITTNGKGIAGMYPDQPETFRWHSDMMQAVGGFTNTSGGSLGNGGNDVVINECYIGGFTADQSELANSALIAKADTGSFKNYTFTNNILDGGNYTLYCFVWSSQGPQSCNNVVVTGNRWGTWGKGYTARYGPVSWGAHPIGDASNSTSAAPKGPNAGVTFSNNTWLQDGEGILTTGIGGKKKITMVKGGPVNDPATGLPPGLHA